MLRRQWKLDQGSPQSEKNRGLASPIGITQAFVKFSRLLPPFHPLKILVWEADEALGFKKFPDDEYFFPNVIFHLFPQTRQYLTQVFTYWNAKYFSRFKLCLFLDCFPPSSAEDSFLTSFCPLMSSLDTILKSVRN